MFNRKINKREKDSIVRDCINALALCHNVTPVIDNEGNKTFQASSPDEIALVKTAEDFGVILKDRNE
jgi:phospholipid-translocating ATPase